MIGSQVSHYRLVRKLGAGTFGEVYEGEHVHDPELRVAVKLVTPSLSDEARFVEALKGECRKLDKMDHPGIVRFRELVMGDRVAMVLELLEGQDLEGRLARGPLDIDTAIAILEAALEALAYAHARGVLHRDIKPSNIFGCDDGRIKLLDFGIARAADGAQATRTGQLVGTLDYMAPERFTGVGGTASSDVYAMGLVAWELLTGTPACPDAELGAKMGWHVLTGVGDVRAARPDCPPWLAEVVSTLAAREPAARPLDGGAALAFVRARREAASRPPPVPPVPPAPPEGRRAAPTVLAPMKEGAPTRAGVPPMPPQLAAAARVAPPAPRAAVSPRAPQGASRSNLLLWVAAIGGTLAILCAVATDAALTMYRQRTAEAAMDDRLVELLLEEPAPAADPPPAEGKIGKRDAKIDMASQVAGQKQQLDREIAENAGVLGALRDDSVDTMFADPAGTAEGLGGLAGTDDRGGLGSRGGADGAPTGHAFGTKGVGGVGTVGGDPIILGALDKSLIDAVIKRNMSQIRYCYQRELTTDPGLGGKITVKFVIAKDGTVSSATTKTSTMNNAAVESCINGRFMRFQFPEPKGGGIVIVTYPFVFSPG